MLSLTYEAQFGACACDPFVNREVVVIVFAAVWAPTKGCRKVGGGGGGGG